MPPVIRAREDRGHCFSLKRSSVLTGAGCCSVVVGCAQVITAIRNVHTVHFLSLFFELVKADLLHGFVQGLRGDVVRLFGAFLHALLEVGTVGGDSLELRLQRLKGGDDRVGHRVLEVPIAFAGKLVFDLLDRKSVV